MIERMQHRRKFGRIRKCQPSGRYQASYTAPDGRLHKAEKTFAAREDAEGWLTDRRREIDRDLWSPPATGEQKKTAAQKKAAGEKFGDYAERWVKTRTVRGRPLKPRTVEHYEKMLNDHILPTFKNKPVRDIDMGMVDRWYAKTCPDRPTMRAHTYSLLRTILETARVRDRLIDNNPCVIRGAGTVSRKIKPRPATFDELDTIVGAMPERLQAMVLLAAWTALRFGELVELRRGDVVLVEAVDTDDDGNEVKSYGGVLKIRRAAVRVDGGWTVGSPKSDAGVRDVEMPSHIVQQIEHHLSTFVAPEADALLFPALSGGFLQPSTLYRSFYKARKAAKRDDLRWHDLRGTGATYFAQTGASLPDIMNRLGQSSSQAAMRYLHAAQGRDKIGAEAMSAAYLAAKKPDKG